MPLLAREDQAVKTFQAIVFGLVTGLLVYWLVRFGGWADGIFSIKTPTFYLYIRILAWVISIGAGVWAALLWRFDDHD